MVLLGGLGMFFITLGVNREIINLYLLGIPFIGLGCTVGN